MIVRFKQAMCSTESSRFGSHRFELRIRHFTAVAQGRQVNLVFGRIIKDGTETLNVI